MAKINLNKPIAGFILPTALFFMVSSLTIVTIYFGWLHSKKNQLEYRIAATKATYNAESGIAEKAYPYLLLSTFEKDTTLQGRSLDINFISKTFSTDRNSCYFFRALRSDFTFVVDGSKITTFFIRTDFSNYFPILVENTYIDFSIFSNNMKYDN